MLFVHQVKITLLIYTLGVVFGVVIRSVTYGNTGFMKSGSLMFGRVLLFGDGRAVVETILLYTLFQLSK